MQQTENKERFWIYRLHQTLHVFEMSSWASAPTVETVLSISMAVGALWCIFVCICQIVRRAANTARKNTAVYRRESTRQSSLHETNPEQSGGTPLHHGSRQLQDLELHPLQPLFLPSRAPASNSSASGCRSPFSNQNPAVNAVHFDGRRPGCSRVTSPVPEEVIYPDYVERVMLPEYVDGMNSYSDMEDIYSAEMNEEPPPYDAVEEHMDFPAPPAYSDLFPYRT